VRSAFFLSIPYSSRLFLFESRPINTIAPQHAPPSSFFKNGSLGPPLLAVVTTGCRSKTPSTVSGTPSGDLFSSLYCSVFPPFAVRKTQKAGRSIWSALRSSRSFFFPLSSRWPFPPPHALSFFFSFGSGTVVFVLRHARFSSEMVGLPPF